jgi:hypothetical protein
MSDDFLMLTVADAVAALVATVNDDLPAGEESPSLTVERRFPDFDLELQAAPAEPVCHVVPAGIKAVEFISRESVTCLVAIDIVIRWRFPTETADPSTGGPRVAAVDPLVSLTQRVLLLLCKHRRLDEEGTRFDATLEEFEARTLTDPGLLRQKQFTSQLRASYLVVKDIPQVAL